MKKIIFVTMLTLLVFVSLSARSENKVVVAGMVFQDDGFMRTVLFGEKDIVASKQNNAIFLSGNCLGKVDKEVELINTYMARGVDAMIISILSPQASAPALKAARQRGIKVILAGLSAPDKEIYDVLYEAKQSDLGKMSGEVAKRHIEKNLAGKPVNVAIIQYKSQVAEQSTARVNGFLDQIKDIKDVKVVADQDAWLSEQAVQRMGAIITAQPNLNIVFAANEGGTVGSTLAVKNAGKGDQIKVFGVDSSEQILEMLLSNDNILQAVTAQDPYRIGKMSAEAAMKLINGEKIEQKDNIVPSVLLSREDLNAVKVYKKSYLRLAKRKL